MNGRRLAILSGVVVALFAFIFLFERKGPTTQERVDRGDVLWDLPEDRVMRISILRGQETIELARGAADFWKIVKPENYPADTSLMSSLVADLSRPPRQGEDRQIGAPPDFGLMAPRAVVTIATREEKGSPAQTRTLSIGREIPGTDTVAARVTGDIGRTVFLRSSLAAELLKPEDAYRSRKIFNGSSSDVSAVAIGRGRGRLEFEKKKNMWWMTKPVADLADDATVSRLVGDLAAENLTEFVKLSPGELSGAGLNPPIYTVALSVGKKAQVLEIGATRSDGKSVYGRAEGQTFALEMSITDELSKEADAYRETKLVRFQNADVKSLAASWNGRTFNLGKIGAEWKELGKTIPSAAVEDFLSTLSTISSKDFLTAEESGSQAAPASAQVRIDLQSGDSWNIAFHPADAKRVAARVSNRPDPLALDRSDFDRLTTAIGKMQPSPESPRPPAPSKK